MLHHTVMMMNCFSRKRFFISVIISGLVVWAWQFIQNIYFNNTTGGSALFKDGTPRIITPLMLNLSRSFIFDFIVKFDPRRSRLSSLVLNGHRDNWKWTSIDCYFYQSKATVHCAIVRHVQEVMVRCDLPELEQTNLTRNLRYFLIRLNIRNAESNGSLTSESPTIRVPVYRRQFHNISIYTMIKNKRQELIEWIEYHRTIGIEHFYLYDNGGDDELENFLKLYMERDLVTIVRWPYKPLPGYYWNVIQSASMNHMLKNFGPFNQWVGYFDVDEYFFPQPDHLALILNGTKSLFELLNASFPLNQYPGGVQFLNCPMSCVMDQESLVKSRYSLTIEKCQIFPPLNDCKKRTKLFIRPIQVPMMQNIHALENTKFADYSSNQDFGLFRHYHYGIVSSVSINSSKSSPLSEKLMSLLKTRVINYKK